MPRNSRAPSRIGIALSPTELVATWDRPDAASSKRRPANGAPIVVWRAMLVPPPADGVAWPSLGEALRGLAAEAGARAALSVALLAPLTEVRTLELPPLRDDERLRLLSRNAARYFINVREPQIVGVAPSSRTKSTSVLAAATPSRLVAMINAEAASAEFAVATVAPAEAAWLSAATTIWPAVARGSASILVTHYDRVDLLRAHDGRLLAVRRFRAGTADAEAIAATLRESDAVAGSSGVATSRAFALGSENESRALIAALSGLGVSATAAPLEWRDSIASPAIAAAAFIDPGERFRLRSDDVVALRTAHTRAVAMQMTAAALLLLVLTAAVEWFGVKRELDTVKSERAAIAAQVRTLLDGQQTSDAMSRRFATISAAHAESPQWSAAIASLTDELDEGSYLLTMRGRGDTLLLDGLARRASRAFGSVERVPEFSAVRAAGEMRVERQEDGTVLERFTIQARVRRDSTGGVR